MKKNIYFEPPSRLQLLDKLKHFLSFSDFLLLVSGSRGAGKSTILAQLLPDPSDSTLCGCFLRPEAEVGPQAVVQQLAKQLPSHEVEAQDFAGQLTAFHNQLKTMRSSGKKCLILIDDAEYLSADALTLLLNLHTADAQLVLMSDHEYAETVLNSPAVKHMEGRVHHISIEGMSVTESLDYLEVCHPAIFSLPDKKKNELIKLAEGMPGRIETLLAGGKVAPSYSVKKATAFPLPVMHMAGIGVVLIGIVAVSLLQFMPEDRQLDEPLLTERLTVPLPVVTSEGDDAKEMVLSPQETGAQTADDAVAQAPVERSVKAELANRLREQERKFKQQAREEKQALPANEAVAVSAAENEQPQSVAVVQRQETTGKAPQESRSLESDLREVVAQNGKLPAGIEERSPGTSPVNHTPKTEPKVAQVPASVPDVPASPKRVTASEQKLLAMPAKSYTLQVLGARSKKSALDFIKKHGGSSKLYYFATVYKGAPWHVVVYGNYPNRDIANASIRKMPVALQKSKPWARSLQGVQLDIKKKN